MQSINKDTINTDCRLLTFPRHEPLLRFPQLQLCVYQNHVPHDPRGIAFCLQPEFPWVLRSWEGTVGFGVHLQQFLGKQIILIYSILLHAGSHDNHRAVTIKDFKSFGKCN